MTSTRTTAPEPMYATLGQALPPDGTWAFEPKYDGMRVIGDVTARSASLVTRNGKSKSAQFPEVVAALRELARRAGRALVVDGEIVARARRRSTSRTPAAGEFQQLQARMHLRDAGQIELLSEEAPVTLVLFDLLREGRTSLLKKPWRERRDALQALFAEADPEDRALTLSDVSLRGRSMLTRARRAGWEGIIAKRADAPYRPGARSDAWLKLKLLFRAEFVVGGFTEPRKSRPHLGALLLGAYDDEGNFSYVGHTGGGFTQAGLGEMRKRLDKLERRTSPFTETPRTNEKAHWVKPQVVVEVKFAEWTKDGILRQPIYLGTRDDKAAKDVTIEKVSAQRWSHGDASDDGA